MSVISLQYGQCGNQIGEQLYSTIYEDIKSESSKSNDVYKVQAVNKWFNVTDSGKWEPRAILIDTETKVVNSRSPKPYTFKNIIAKSTGGAANNWAYGYSQKSKLLQTQVLETLRAEVERSDFITSILNIYSSSGGTGSGVGSKIIEEIREIYPNKPIINIVVLPYFKGEVVTQGFNTVLTLAKLYSVADSTILFENDNLHYICNNVLSIKNINISHLNDIIAQQIATVYQPVRSVSTSDVLLDLTSHPSYRFLHLKSAPHFLKENLKFEAARNWKSLVQNLSKQYRYEYQQQTISGIKIKSRCVSNAVISRGVEKPSALDMKQLIESTSYVNWVPSSERCKNFHEQRSFNNIDKHLTVVLNNSSIYLPLNMIVEDAWNLFTYGAYLHHYETYGVDKEFFLQNFQIMENILHEYKSL